MSHFAKINNNNIVTQMIVADQDFINSGAVGDSFLWIQTSYNGNFRKKFASVGYTYDKVNDVFIEPQPYPSWTLDSNQDWQAPIAQPDPDELGRPHQWNETMQAWVAHGFPGHES